MLKHIINCQKHAINCLGFLVGTYRFHPVWCLLNAIASFHTQIRFFFSFLFICLFPSGILIYTAQYNFFSRMLSIICHISKCQLNWVSFYFDRVSVGRRCARGASSRKRSCDERHLPTKRQNPVLKNTNF